MRRVVLDASAFLDWFTPSASGRALRAEYESGQLRVHVPTSFSLHVLEAAASRDTMTGSKLEMLAAELDRIGFDSSDPPVPELVSWLARGLGAGGAAYAALASALAIPLETHDPELLRTAATVARQP